MDAAPVGLHDPLADGQPQAGVAASTLPLPAGEPTEQMRQVLGGYPPPPVGHRDLNVATYPHGGHLDDRILGGVPRRVGQQVADDLHGAPPVRHDQGQVRLYLHFELVPAPAVSEAARGRAVRQRDCASIKRRCIKRSTEEGIENTPTIWLVV